jgi:phage portal protein BeeE
MNVFSRLFQFHGRDKPKNSYQSDKGQVKFRRESILHIPGLGFDGLIGYSLIAMAKNAVGLALATEDYGAAFFARRNGSI